MPTRLSENVVENARNGERFVFRPATGGTDALPFDFVVKAGGGMTLKHRHLDQNEWFRCVSGELTVLLEDSERVLRPGEEIVIPPGAVHAFCNRGAVETVCDVEYRPAGRNEDWLKIVNAIETKTGREPSLLDIAPFILDVGIFIEGPPIALQRMLFAVLRVVATALGRKKAGLAAATELYGRPFVWD